MGTPTNSNPLYRSCKNKNLPPSPLFFFLAGTCSQKGERFLKVPLKVLEGLVSAPFRCNSSPHMSPQHHMGGGRAAIWLAVHHIHVEATVLRTSTSTWCVPTATKALLSQQTGSTEMLKWDCREQPLLPISGCSDKHLYDAYRHTRLDLTSCQLGPA